MGPLILLAIALIAIPWSIRNWWQMYRARSPKEKAFLGRAVSAGWIFFGLTAVLLMVLKGRALLFALPVVTVAGAALQHIGRKALARIQAEEADPLSRARRIN